MTSKINTVLYFSGNISLVPFCNSINGLIYDYTNRISEQHRYIAMCKYKSFQYMDEFASDRSQDKKVKIKQQQNLPCVQQVKVHKDMTQYCEDVYMSRSDKSVSG